MDKVSRAEQLEQKRTYWKQHINSWQVTGLTQAEYCWIYPKKVDTFKHKVSPSVFHIQKGTDTPA